MASFRLRTSAVVRLVAIVVVHAHAARIIQTASLATHAPIEVGELTLSLDRLAAKDWDADADLQLTFRYPAGPRNATIKAFDIRPEVCIAVGGVRHGDIVIAESGLVGTVIGVRHRKGNIYCHFEGYQGATWLTEPQLFRVVSNVGVPEGGLPDGAAPSAGVQWLMPTFEFAAGPTIPKVEKFDIRDEVCLKVGGFRHGQVVKDEIGNELQVIGVRRERDGGVYLWFLPPGALGAGTLPFRMLLLLRWVRTRLVLGDLSQTRFEGTFLYPAGVRDRTVEAFDIRPEICVAAGGARHGDVVLLESGRVGTVIGVKAVLGKLRLWTHWEGDPGASVFHEAPLLRVVSSVIVPECGLPDGEAPSAGVQWLAPTFQYKAGYIPSKVQHFDIRDEVCLKVGGYRHGQILTAGYGIEMFVIGVRRDDADGRVALWLHQRRDVGALPVDVRILQNQRVQWVATQFVPEHAAPRITSGLGELRLDRTFPYPTSIGGGRLHVEGLDIGVPRWEHILRFPGKSSLETFDVRPEICVRVGGARHGDIVLSEDGIVATVVGVREDPSGVPRLWVHENLSPGATFFENPAEELRVVSKVAHFPEPPDDLFAYAPSLDAEWWKPTFWYPLEDGTPAKFDIRDDICLSVGGFRHGQVVELIATIAVQLVVIGVRISPMIGQADLYVSKLQTPGASILTFGLLRAVRPVRSMRVEELAVRVGL